MLAEALRSGRAARDGLLRRGAPELARLLGGRRTTSSRCPVDARGAGRGQLARIGLAGDRCLAAALGARARRSCRASGRLRLPARRRRSRQRRDGAALRARVRRGAASCSARSTRRSRSARRRCGRAWARSSGSRWSRAPGSSSCAAPPRRRRSRWCRGAGPAAARARRRRRDRCSCLAPSGRACRTDRRRAATKSPTSRWTRRRRVAERRDDGDALSVREPPLHRLSRAQEPPMTEPDEPRPRAGAGAPRRPRRGGRARGARGLHRRGDRGAAGRATSGARPS